MYKLGDMWMGMLEMYIRREIWAKLESKKTVRPGREVHRTHCWGMDSPSCSKTYDPPSGHVAARCLFLNHSSAGSLTLLKNLLWLLFSWVLWFGIHDPPCSNPFSHCSLILPFPLPHIHPYTKTKTIFSFLNKTLIPYLHAFLFCSCCSFYWNSLYSKSYLSKYFFIYPFLQIIFLFWTPVLNHALLNICTLIYFCLVCAINS